MRSRNRLYLALLGVTAATLARAAEQAPAWQAPGFVMEEIVVTLPLSNQVTHIEHDVVAEIIVVLSLEEQARIRETSSAAAAIELVAQGLGATTRL